MAYPTTLDDFVPYLSNIKYYSRDDLAAIRTAVIALETALGYGATVPTTSNAASSIVKRDASGNFNGGLITAASGVNSVKSAGSAFFGLDVSQTGTALAIANTQTATPFGASAVFSGLFMVNDTLTDGRCALFMKGDAIVKIAETTANTYTTTQSTASRVNVYLASGVVTIENLWGSSRTFNVMAFRSRAA
jgi:hypothetical protein